MKSIKVYGIYLDHRVLFVWRRLDSSESINEDICQRVVAEVGRGRNHLHQELDENLHDHHNGHDLPDGVSVPNVENEIEIATAIGGVSEKEIEMWIVIATWTEIVNVCMIVIEICAIKRHHRQVSCKSLN